MSCSAIVIDDDELVRGAICRQLTHLGLSKVEAAGDGADATLKLLRTGPYDLIVLDLMMPGMDGIEFMRQMAGANASADLILTSSLDHRMLESAESLARAHKLHVLGALPKPVRKSALEGLLALRNKSAGAKRLESMSPERLRVALERGYIIPHYQPKVCARNGILRSVEALARWVDPAEGLISPARFIDVAEREGLMTELSRVMCSAALRDVRSWRVHGFEPDLEINLSATSLNSIALPEQMRALSVEHQVDPARITFEITESALMCQPAQSLETVTRLRMCGFHLAIDDFGTGFSTLTQLRLLPLSEIKIDQSFVGNAARDPGARAIVDSCLRLARDFGLVSVAEGVEDERTAQLMRELGATLLQGYWFAKPMSADALVNWWRSPRR
jgi:EAL domain-containing protein (putative c-di-GMP-specific phosphodiesterase class I)/AmiR/NasT family two-component response regulator